MIGRFSNDAPAIFLAALAPVAVIGCGNQMFMYSPLCGALAS
jgi:hypothetical protein